MDIENERPRGGNKSEILEKYKTEIFSMRSKGFSYPQIVEFLKSKGFVVSVSLVSAFLRNSK
ncbi:hypothetical protein [Pseudomonas amygdali]|uniref:hypothetical protein n=1 Tax=Pseudomonas amygdali TaxID=47877 RepID=UPI0011C49EB0|nr:hypothetical protein [Pseudomonas amygdali]